MGTKQTVERRPETAVRGRIDVLADGAAVFRPFDRKATIRIAKSDVPNFVANGDIVDASLDSGHKNVTVERVVKRDPVEFEGILQIKRSAAFVVPDNPLASRKIFVQNKETLTKEQHGRRVLARLKGVDQKDPRPSAEVLQQIEENSVLDDVLSKICDDYKISTEFPSEIPQAAAKLDARTYQDGPFVTDLRSLPLVTIDGFHAKDFDDAVWVKRTDAGFEAIVAVADVSSYVREGDAIDTEAIKRGTSVYFPQEVYPMLPERLSNDLCSLVPGQDRPVVAVRLGFDADGTRTGAELLRGLLHSHARLTYTQVNDYLERGKEDQVKHASPHVRKMLNHMHDLTELRWEQRRRRGALEFDLPEPEFVIGLNGEVSEILYRDRGPAQRMIEELMISANEAVAELLDEAGLPILYRCHPEPPKEKYEIFRKFTHNLGFKVPPVPSPEAFKNIVSAAAGTPLERSVNVLVLRTMSQAEYSMDNVGHFGLSLDHYCHFTSPIRRYPDLINHRWAIRFLTRGGIGVAKADEIRKASKDLVSSLSEKERQAEQAERTYVRSLKARFLESRVGEKFSGVVSGCAKFGLFIELEDYLIDGLLPMREIGNDFFVYDEQRNEIFGKNSGVRFRIGDLVEVELISVDVAKGFIDFRLIEHDPISYGRLSR